MAQPLDVQKLPMGQQTPKQHVVVQVTSQLLTTKSQIPLRQVKPLVQVQSTLLPQPSSNEPHWPL